MGLRLKNPLTLSLFLYDSSKSELNRSTISTIDLYSFWYLNRIKNSGLWEVHCGEDAYNKIDELTGAKTVDMRKDIFDFTSDLSERFLQDLESQLPNLASYLEW